MAPVQWPVRQGSEPQARFFAEGGFFANDFKARFIAPEMPALRTETTAGAPAAAEHRPHPRSVAHHDPHRRQARGSASICRSRSSRFIPTMPLTLRRRRRRALRASPPTTGNARFASSSASASSAACCSRRSTGARPTPPARGSVRWWRLHRPVLRPAREQGDAGIDRAL